MLRSRRVNEGGGGTDQIPQGSGDSSADFRKARPAFHPFFVEIKPAIDLDLQSVRARARPTWPLTTSLARVPGYEPLSEESFPSGGVPVPAASSS